MVSVSQGRPGCPGLSGAPPVAAAGGGGRCRLLELDWGMGGHGDSGGQRSRGGHILGLLKKAAIQ